MEDKCKNFQTNMDNCNCSYPNCPRKGNCCECIQYHLNRRELPACAFPDEVEESYDRSFDKFIEVYS